MSELNQIEKDIAENEVLIANAETVAKLQKTSAFKEVFEKDYFDKEIKRLVKALAKNNEDGRKEIFSRLLGVSYTMEHLDMQTLVANVAKENIEQLKEARAEILNGEEA